jgi:hypothetical protein
VRNSKNCDTPRRSSQRGARGKSPANSKNECSCNLSWRTNTSNLAECWLARYPHRAGRAQHPNRKAAHPATLPPEYEDTKQYASRHAHAHSLRHVGIPRTVITRDPHKWLVMWQIAQTYCSRMRSVTASAEKVGKVVSARKCPVIANSATSGVISLCNENSSTRKRSDGSSERGA